VIHAAVVGFVTSLTLIAAIGAQNAYVLRQGVLRSHVVAVVAVCALSDVVLMFAGAAGIGVLVDRAGFLLDVVRWFGVLFLLWYAFGCLRRARKPEALFAADGTVAEPRGRVIGRVMALTWLNPHVYIDTVLLLGSIAAAQDAAAGGRWWFAAGAGLASVVWFNALGFGATLLAPILARPRVWQVVEVLIAATMVLVAAKLAVG
jgi:L-lysine exporter family protein LysE/ArgO